MPVFGAVEDLVLGILRPYLEGKGVTVAAELYKDMPLPAVVPLHVESSNATGTQTKDQQFIQSVTVQLNTITQGVEADVINAELQEACRDALLQAWLQQIVVPGVGSINRVDQTSKGARQPDIGNYGLPHGVVLHEATYRLLMRPDQTTPATNRFITPAP